MPLLRRFVLIDLGLLLAVCVPAILLCFTHAFAPRRHGFFLDDPDIQYPHVHESVSMVTVAIVSVGVPLFLMFAFEYGFHRRYADIELLPADYLVTRLLGKSIVFFFGAVFTVLWSSWMKLATGRLRPDFIALCVPNVARPYPHEYVLDSVCMNYVYQGYLSFPSSHAALSFYGMTFAALYIWYFLGHESRLLKPIVALGLLIFPTYVALSRVADNSHFGSDVVAGALLGAIMAAIAFFQAQSVEEIDVKIDEREPLLRTRPAASAPGAHTGVHVIDTPPARSTRMGATAE